MWLSWSERWSTVCKSWRSWVRGPLQSTDYWGLFDSMLRSHLSKKPNAYQRRHCDFPFKAPSILNSIKNAHINKKKSRKFEPPVSYDFEYVGGASLPIVNTVKIKRTPTLTLVPPTPRYTAKKSTAHAMYIIPITASTTPTTRAQASLQKVYTRAGRVVCSLYS